MMVERTFPRFDSLVISLVVRISFAALVNTHLLGRGFVLSICSGDVGGGARRNKCMGCCRDSWRKTNDRVSYRMLQLCVFEQSGTLVGLPSRE